MNMNELIKTSATLYRTLNELKYNILDEGTDLDSRKNDIYETMVKYIDVTKQIKVLNQFRKNNVENIEDLPENIQKYIELMDVYKNFYENPSTLESNREDFESVIYKKIEIDVLEQMDIINLEKSTPVPESTVSELIDLVAQNEILRNTIPNNIDEFEESQNNMKTLSDAIRVILESIRPPRLPDPMNDPNFVGKVSTYEENESNN
jgi:peptidoglycan hydrolase CwlO-like protein